jgi:hypothetical protein
LYAKIDTEAPRYLGFERWWGGHVNLNAAEIQFIVDELFIGNNLAAGKILTTDGVAVDLRNVRSPIVVFCSKGDNITPPQQALGWLLDLYNDESEIRAYGQTIVYTIHDRVGHLGIFVSGSVARKEHDEFSSNIDLIDTLPPGLYEAVFEPKTDDTAGADLVSGDWVMRCEARTLDDIRMLGGNDVADDHRFATVDRVSQTNLALYRTFMQPFVRALTNPLAADFMRDMHPLRLQFEMFSNANPMMAPIASLAEQVRNSRKPVSSDNPFIAIQENVSGQIVAALDAWRDAIEALSERTFLTIYGSTTLQAAHGIDSTKALPLRRAPKNALHYELVQRRIAELKSRIASGGLREAVIRSVIFAGLGRAAVDERGFEAVRRIRRAYDGVPLPTFKAMVREQYEMLLIDPDAALAAIPSMLPADAQTRRKAFDLVNEIMRARGEASDQDAQRLAQIGRLFAVGGRLNGPDNPAIASATQTEEQAKAS